MQNSEHNMMKNQTMGGPYNPCPLVKNKPYDIRDAKAMCSIENLISLEFIPIFDKKILDRQALRLYEGCYFDSSPEIGKNCQSRCVVSDMAAKALQVFLQFSYEVIAFKKLQEMPNESTVANSEDLKILPRKNEFICHSDSKVDPQQQVLLRREEMMSFSDISGEVSDKSLQSVKAAQISKNGKMPETADDHRYSHTLNH